MSMKSPVEAYTRRIWNTQSRWGRRHRMRLAVFWTCVASGAIIGTLMGLLAR